MPPASNARGQMLLPWAVVFGLAVWVFAGWVGLPRSPAADPTLILLIWVNVALILIGLGLEIGRRPYSLHLMHLLSAFLFLGAASLFQYTRGRLGVPGPITSLRDQLPYAVLATTFWITGYLITYELCRAIRRRPPAGRFLTRPMTFSRVMLLAVFGMSGLVYLAGAGLVGATTRAAAEGALMDFASQAGAGVYSNALYILTYSVARAVPGVALMAALLFFTRVRGQRPVLIYVVVGILGIGTLFANNPFAANRMFLTCTLIAFAAPFALQRFRTAWALVLSIVIGLAVLPGLGNARNSVDFNDALYYYLDFVSPWTYLATNSDVDSLGMTGLCQKWIDRFGHTWGRQILGAFLSFVPRAIWPTKPIGTGGMVTRDLGFEFTNLSPPINAEFLVDFGLPGTFLGAAVFALILYRIDTIYWSREKAQDSTRAVPGIRILDVIYPFLLVCITFYTRGDMFAATAFTESFVVWLLPLGFAIRATRPTSLTERRTEAFASSP